MLDETQINLLVNQLPASVQKILAAKLDDASIHETDLDIARYIDHTLLHANSESDQIAQVCKEAKENNFFSVCIPPSFISFAKEYLKGSNTKVCTVIGFPLGHQTTETKVFECTDAITKGAQEIDMVMNIGALKSKNYELIFEELSAVKKACAGTLLKVILETCLLTKEEISLACLLAKAANADFVKTSTGFSNSGATTDHIRLMRTIVGNKMGVKASGGVRTKDDALAMIEAGASRLGCSASLNIVQANSKSTSEGY